MRRRVIRIGLLIIASGLSATKSRAQTADCIELNASKPGVVGQLAASVWGTTAGEAVTLLDIVRGAAPVIWFSPDEPLLNGFPAKANIPAPVPAPWQWPPYSFGALR